MELKILKYKKISGNRYQIDFDNGKQLLLYEEIILKYELLLKKEVTEAMYLEMNLGNQEWDVYYVGLRMLRSRFKSAKELKEALLKKEYPLELIEKAVERLLEQKYLDDRSFTRGYINNQMITTSKGPNKLHKELLLKGVSLEYIQEEIGCFDEMIEQERLVKLIDKAIRSNHSRGGRVLKNKIVQDMIQLGYTPSLVSTVIEEYQFDNDSTIAKKEYEKLYRRLSRKYKDKELELKIKEKLYQKGLYYEDQELD